MPRDTVHCSGCGVEVYRDVAHHDFLSETHFCRSCYLAELMPDDYYGDDDDEPPREIESYTYKPSPQFFKMPGETLDALFLGIELEIELKDACEFEVVQATKANWTYLKADASLRDGLEIVTHPLSFAWICANRKRFSGMLKELRGLGAQSHTPGTCGLHVHMSRRAISNGTLTNMMKLIYENPGRMLILSRRTQEQVQQWSKLSINEYYPLSQAITQKINGYDRNRYETLNLCNSQTVEFRLWRGTLKTSTFFGCIEFCVALFLYARATREEDISWEGFMTYILTLGAEFTNVAQMISERLDQATATTYSERE